MKARNLTLYSSDPALLDKWYEEYSFLGRNVRKSRGKVVVSAYPRKEKKDAPKRGREKTEAAKKPEHTEQRSKRERWYE